MGRSAVDGAVGTVMLVASVGPRSGQRHDGRPTREAIDLNLQLQHIPAAKLDVRDLVGLDLVAEG